MAVGVNVGRGVDVGGGGVVVTVGGKADGLGVNGSSGACVITALVCVTSGICALLGAGEGRQATRRIIIAETMTVINRFNNISDTECSHWRTIVQPYLV